VNDRTTTREDVRFDAMTHALDDEQFNDYVVRTVASEQLDDEGKTYVELTFVNGWSLNVTNELGASRMPKTGDTLRLFGRGFGYPIRGIGRLNDHGALCELYRYMTEEQQKRAHEAEVAQSHERKKREWQADKEKNAARVAAMPEAFRKRFEHFDARPNWGWDFGSYELFTMEEAVKIAAALKTGDAVVAFAKQSAAVQKETVPGLAHDQLSRNMFDAACYLARVFIEAPERLWQVHGAMCPLVGCKEYGCWASTPAAARERRERVVPPS